MTEPAKSASQPLVTIVIPTYNRERYLEQTVRSVLDQSYRNVECIVVDGASKDGTVAMLERIAATDPRLKFISEPDKGEVYAANKGWDMATGDIIGFQASDDYYVPGAFATAVEFLLTHPEYVGVGGDARYVDEHGKDTGRGVITYRGEMSHERIRHIIVMRYKSCAICHGAFFGWRKRLLAHGKFDTNFTMICDWEYYLRQLEAGERIASLPRVQYHFRIHSTMGAVLNGGKAEVQRVSLHQKYGLKWYHEFARATVGRAAVYVANPHRSPFVSGLAREIKEMFRR